MLKKVSAVALSASMLAVSNCAISTKATGEEKATVATATQTKEQNKIVEFCKENWVKLLAGAGITLGTVAGPIVVYYTFFRNHLQAEIDSLVKLAKKDVSSEKEEKQNKHKEALKAKAKKVLEAAEWVIIASKDNKETKENVEKAIKALFTNATKSNKVFGDKVELDKVETKETAEAFLTKMGEVFVNLEKEKVKSEKEEKEAYRVRKNRGFFMQYKDANEVAKMFTDAVEAIGK